MKNYTKFIFIVCCSLATFAQEKEDLNLFETDSTWFKEVIKFPIGFAQNIQFEGFEDLRFPPGWSKQDSPEFWSYIWAWSLNDIKSLSETEIETNIQYYFNGLLGIGPDSQGENKAHNTNAVFVKKENSSGHLQYVGKVKTFDTRYTKKPMTLYVMVDSYYCEKENKTIIHFRFSPQTFEHDVWNTLNSVKLNSDVCEN